MEKNEQNEIELSQIFRVLLNKWWIVALATIAGIILGGVFGFVRYKDKDYYGATVKYDVSIVSYVGDDLQKGTNYSYTASHMNRMTELLSEDKFMEKLMQRIDGAPTRDDAEKFFPYMSALKKSLSFSYNENNFNSLYVTVSVLNNKEFAETLLETVEAEVPLYVQERMIIPSSNDTTKYQTTCEEQTIATVQLLNAGQSAKEAVKFGLILGAAALVIACVAVVIADNSDKRLRDYQKFSERYGITVLGVIPALGTNGNKEEMK